MENDSIDAFLQKRTAEHIDVGRRYVASRQQAMEAAGIEPDAASSHTVACAMAGCLLSMSIRLDQAADIARTIASDVRWLMTANIAVLLAILYRVW